MCYFSVLCFFIAKHTFLLGGLLLNKRFFEILTEVAYGLVKKEQQYEKRIKDENYQYFQQPELIASIQKLALFMLENGVVNESGFPIAPKNETDAILNYFSKTLDEWPCIESSNYHSLIMGLVEEERLVHVYDNDLYFYTTDWCKELADECRTLNEDATQQSVYLKLRRVSKDGQYIYLRKFIIEHPIIDMSEKFKFINEGEKIGLEKNLLEEIIDAAYEVIPPNVVGECSYCGWTVSEKYKHKSCIDSRCRFETDNFSNINSISQTNTKMRLKSGVMKYICLPGKDELELVMFCNKLKIEANLWPNKDSYDVQIKLKNKILAIDVKSYYSPYLLAYHIEHKGVFNKLNSNEEAILVIPNYRILKQGYLEIVNKSLPSSNIKCLSMKQLQKRLREEVK